jgi:Rod binding domain-containing protein
MTTTMPTSISPATFPTAVQPRLVRAAHEFEAQMMKELLKPMTSSTLEGSEDSAEGSNGALGEFASESLGKALSEQGGFGIANQIIGHFSHSGTHSAPAAVTKNVNFNTGLNVHK